MKKMLLAIATVITTAAASTSLYLAILPNPTDMQKQLSNTANTIAVAGSAAIFGMLDDQDGDQKKGQERDE